MHAEKLQVVSYSDVSFTGRAQAGKLLAENLQYLKGKNTVVLGIPRGGMVIANEIYRALNADLDIVLARKIGAPGEPELAIGSVGEDGKLLLNDDLVFRTGADKFYIEEENQRQLAEIRKREKIFRKVKPKVPLNGRTVIITDDGVATGATMQAALWSVRQENPQKLIVAVPIGAKESVELLSLQADRVIVLRVPQYLGAIGGFYEHFEQSSDAQVLEFLKGSVKEAAHRKGAD